MKHPTEVLAYVLTFQMKVQTLCGLTPTVASLVVKEATGRQSTYQRSRPPTGILILVVLQLGCLFFQIFVSFQRLQIAFYSPKQMLKYQIWLKILYGIRALTDLVYLSSYMAGYGAVDSDFYFPW